MISKKRRVFRNHIFPRSKARCTIFASRPWLSLPDHPCSGPRPPEALVAYRIFAVHPARTALSVITNNTGHAVHKEETRSRPPLPAHDQLSREYGLEVCACLSDASVIEILLNADGTHKRLLVRPDLPRAWNHNRDCKVGILVARSAAAELLLTGIMLDAVLLLMRTPRGDHVLPSA